MIDPSDEAHPCPSKIARATLDIVRNGRYRVSRDGDISVVKLEPLTRLKMAGRSVCTIDTTQNCIPSTIDGLEDKRPGFTLFQGDAFDAAKWLEDSIPSTSSRGPCILDFASDSEPGGGWKGKQQGTQEEALCRRSNLGECLTEHYERVGPAEYMPFHSVVHVPDVVVFRASKTYKLLLEPFWVSVVAAALRNVGADALIRAKIEGVVRVMAERGYRQLILGAWGCGAFGNEPQQIARHMTDAVIMLSCWFDHVVFAVPDGNNFEAFQASLPTCTEQIKPALGSQDVKQFKLTDQHRCEILVELPDMLDTVVSRVHVEPDSVRSKEGAKQKARDLFYFFKDVCMEHFNTGSPQVAQRLSLMLPTTPIDRHESLPTDLSKDEHRIVDEYQEAVRGLVMEFIRQQRAISNKAFDCSKRR